MKKYLYLSMLLALMVNGVNAQKIRFTDTANEWKIESVKGIIGESCQELAIIRMGTDTIIKGIIYKKIETRYDHYACEAPSFGGTRSLASTLITGGFYREDTLLKRVYCLSAWSGDAIEHIIFDANWKIGDTLKWGNPSGYKYDHGQNYIAGFDSALINGIWHKAFLVSYDTLNPKGRGFMIIEGIGCLNGIGFPVHAIRPFENSDYLRCFKQNGSLPSFSLVQYGNLFPFNNTSCAVVQLSTGDKPALKSGVQITPNPGNSAITLHLPASIHSASVQITDCTGRIIQKLSTSISEINIGQYLSTPGVYYYQVQDAASGQRYTGKFIFNP